MMQRLPITFCLLLTLCLSAGTLAGSEQAGVKQEASSEVVWVDVRSWLENKLDSIDGDPNIPIDNIMAGITEQFPDKNTAIRLYCASGGRAGKALSQLIGAGYGDVQNMGGISDVRKLRFPIEDVLDSPKLID